MSFGNQGINFSTTGTLPANSANYQSQLSNPAAYALPVGNSPGGILCDPSRNERANYRRVLHHLDRADH